MQDFLSAFIPLFVAIDVLGILPLFISLTNNLTTEERQSLVIRALLTATVVALCVLFAGQFIFKALGITLNDLRIGGGLVLLILSITDLVFPDIDRKTEDGEVGVVPLGIPLVMGPSAITTIIVSQQNFGYTISMAALVANLALVLVVFYFGPYLLGLLGKQTTQAIAKVASLFMTAIAVAMIRTGIMGIMGG
jgi:multiple antibiotic resistance protein